MGMRIYSLFGGNETKFWYPLDLNMDMGMNFLY